MEMGNKCASTGFGHLGNLLKFEVFRQSFWMSRWGGKSPKRTTLWSNSSGIRYFATTKKYARMKARSAKQKLADIYFDRHGQKRYKGNAKLKASQPYT